MFLDFDRQFGRHLGFMKKLCRGLSIYLLLYSYFCSHPEKLSFYNTSCLAKLKKSCTFVHSCTFISNWLPSFLTSYLDIHFQLVATFFDVIYGPRPVSRFLPTFSMLFSR